jgi:hypothetical protein
MKPHYKIHPNMDTKMDSHDQAREDAGKKAKAQARIRKDRPNNINRL